MQPDVPDRLIADPTRLRQVIVNLVGNAIKFTDQGEIVVEVRGEGQTDGRMTLHFAVRDTGIGIAADKQAAVFEAFEQADTSTTRKFGGTGLGLAISTRLVDLMGGRMWLESEPGVGSTFHFTAPVAVAPLDSSEPHPTPATSLRGMRILVVDDNATNRTILEEILTNWEMRPCVATGADEALEMMRAAAAMADPYLVVLADCQMPDADGFALCECIKQEPQLASAVILMISSSDKPGEINRCEQAGIAAYLLKPVKQSELFDTIVAGLQIHPVDDHRAEALAANPRRSCGPLRILLVEDSVVNQKLAVALLQRAGHQVAVAENGRIAVDRLRSEVVDVVLMDVQMPVMDGLEATAAIRRRERREGGHVPIIAMTAHAMKGDREQCFAAGMDGYVTKPIRSEELLAALDKFAAQIEPAAAAEPAETRELPATPSDAPSDSSTSSSGPTAAAAGPLDAASALRHLGGDRALLAELAAAFRNESRGLMAQLREAIVAQDAARLRRAAHTLKGAAGVFGPNPACETARQLEALGRAGDLAPTGPLLTTLEAQVEQLIHALG